MIMRGGGYSKCNVPQAFHFPTCIKCYYERYSYLENCIHYTVETKLFRPQKFRKILSSTYCRSIFPTGSSHLLTGSPNPMTVSSYLHIVLSDSPHQQYCLVVLIYCTAWQSSSTDWQSKSNDCQFSSTYCLTVLIYSTVW